MDDTQQFHSDWPLTKWAYATGHLCVIKCEWTHVYEGHKTCGKTYIQLAVAMCWWSSTTVVKKKNSRWSRKHMVLQKHPHTTPHNFQGIISTSREGPSILSGIGRCRHCGAYKRTAYQARTQSNIAYCRTTQHRCCYEPPNAQNRQRQSTATHTRLAHALKSIHGGERIHWLRAHILHPRKAHRLVSGGEMWKGAEGAGRRTIAFSLLKK